MREYEKCPRQKAVGTGFLSRILEKGQDLGLSG